MKMADTMLFWQDILFEKLREKYCSQNIKNWDFLAVLLFFNLFYRDLVKCVLLQVATGSAVPGFFQEIKTKLAEIE
jgi:hypothetical protein